MDDDNILKPMNVLSNLDETVAKFDTLSIVRPVCNHRPGKFLGQCFSPNYERYQCVDCGKEFSRYIENR